MATPDTNWQVALLNSSCLYSKRSLTSENCYFKDSLHHRFRLLRGRPGITKVSGSLFRRHLETRARLRNCWRCTYCPGWASTFPALSTIAWPCTLNIFPTCIPVGLTPSPWCSSWPMSLLTHRESLPVVIGSAPRDSAALNATVTLMLLKVGGCLVGNDVNSVTRWLRNRLFL